ncbi:cytochrome c oxidase subunit II [Mesorhizobium loti NZP2037]|nr:cytochrome c oxidase subunit II [Mesorhizobium loti NZP2037]
MAVAGCSRTRLSYLDATSPVAGALANLGLGLTVISVGVCVIVGVLLLVAIWHRRPEGDLEIAPVNDRAAIRWIGIGVAISTVFLLGSAVWTLATVNSIGEPGQAKALNIDVIGQEWWWAVKYHSGDPAREFITANQLVIPVGVPVQINLTSKDVIHSFWVPKLGGKMDMIPSRTNVTWLQADKVGDFRGQCSEFCGLQHANMAFDVRVLSRTDFDAWWERQLQPATGSADDPRLRTFMARCAACHTIRGTLAGGILGPDLSHFGDRETIASGLMSNTPANLKKWINNTQTIKPGVKMPELHMLASEIDDVTTYLEGLK